MECTLFKRISDKLEWLKIKFFNLFARKRKSIPVYENLTEFKNIHFNDFEDMDDTSSLEDIYLDNDSYISYDNNLEFSDI